MKSTRNKRTGLILVVAILTGSPGNQAGLVLAGPPRADASRTEETTASSPLIQDCPDLLLSWPKRLLKRAGRGIVTYGRDLRRTRTGRFFMVPQTQVPAEAAWGFLIRRAGPPKIYDHPISWTAQRLSRRMREKNYHVSFTNLLIDRPARCITARCLGRPYRWTIPMHLLMLTPVFVIGWKMMWSRINRGALDQEASKHLTEDYRFADLRASPNAPAAVERESLERYIALRTFYDEQGKLRGVEGFGMPPNYEEVAEFYRTVDAKKFDGTFSEKDLAWALSESERTLIQPGSRHLLARLRLLQHPLLAETAELISNTNRYPAGKFYLRPGSNRALSFHNALDLKAIDELVGLDELRHWKWLLVEKLAEDPDGDPLRVTGLPDQPENRKLIADLVEQPVPKLLEALVRRGRLTRAQKTSFWMEDIDNEIWFARMGIFEVEPIPPEAGRPPLQRRDFQVDLLTDVAAASAVPISELTALLDELSASPIPIQRP